VTRPGPADPDRLQLVLEALARVPSPASAQDVAVVAGLPAQAAWRTLTWARGLGLVRNASRGPRQPGAWELVPSRDDDPELVALVAQVELVAPVVDRVLARARAAGVGAASWDELRAQLRARPVVQLEAAS